MRTIQTRYGASVALTVTSSDPDADTATIYVGLPQETAVLTKTGSFVAGVADISLLPTDTDIPLGTYNYQINVVYGDGRIEKYPNPKSCDGDELPEFIVVEALDVTEVS
jgi:hypothetical protein